MAAVMPRQPTPTRPCRGLAMSRPTAVAMSAGSSRRSRSARASTFASRERVDATASVVLTSSSSSMATVCHAGRGRRAGADTGHRVTQFQNGRMGIIVANLFITLDGVYQAPGGREEDTADGFAFGGWQAPVSDDEAGAAIGAEIDRIDALLLGRKTYDIFAAYWPHRTVRRHRRRAQPGPQVRRLQHPDRSRLGGHHGAAGCRGRGTAPRGVRRGAHVRQRRAHPFTAGGRRARPPPPLALSGHPRAGQAPLRRRDRPASFRLAEPARTFPKGAVSLVYERAGDVETRETCYRPTIKGTKNRPSRSWTGFLSATRVARGYNLSGCGLRARPRQPASPPRGSRW